MGWQGFLQYPMPDHRKTLPETIDSNPNLKIAHVFKGYNDIPFLLVGCWMAISLFPSWKTIWESRRSTKRDEHLGKNCGILKKIAAMMCCNYLIRFKTLMGFCLRFLDHMGMPESNPPAENHRLMVFQRLNHAIKNQVTN